VGQLIMHGREHLAILIRSASRRRRCNVEELIALTGDYRVARAAFEEAVKRRPGRIVTLRQKTRLLAENRKP
jgi:hypothetical protein